MINQEYENQEYQDYMAIQENTTEAAKSRPGNQYLSSVYENFEVSNRQMSNSMIEKKVNKAESHETNSKDEQVYRNLEQFSFSSESKTAKLQEEINKKINELRGQRMLTEGEEEMEKGPLNNENTRNYNFNKGLTKEVSRPDDIVPQRKKLNTRSKAGTSFMGLSSSFDYQLRESPSKRDVAHSQMKSITPLKQAHNRIQSAYMLPTASSQNRALNTKRFPDSKSNVSKTRPNTLKQPNVTFNTNGVKGSKDGSFNKYGKFDQKFDFQAMKDKYLTIHNNNSFQNSSKTSPNRPTIDRKMYKQKYTSEAVTPTTKQGANQYFKQQDHKTFGRPKFTVGGPGYYNQDKSFVSGSSFVSPDRKRMPSNPKYDHVQSKVSSILRMKNSDSQPNKLRQQSAEFNNDEGAKKEKSLKKFTKCFHQMTKSNLNIKSHTSLNSRNNKPGSFDQQQGKQSAEQQTKQSQLKTKQKQLIQKNNFFLSHKNSIAKTERKVKPQQSPLITARPSPKPFLKEPKMLKNVKSNLTIKYDEPTPSFRQDELSSRYHQGNTLENDNYDLYKREFDAVIRKNNFKQMVDREQLAVILIDLGFSIDSFQHQSMSLKQQIEYILNLSKFNLLWTILIKTQLKTASMQNAEFLDLADVFTILAAILDLQVSELVNTITSQIQHTQNPLLYRNKLTSKLIFTSYSELQKFSVKFKAFKTNYYNFNEWRKDQLHDHMRLQSREEKVLKQKQAHLQNRMKEFIDGNIASTARLSSKEQNLQTQRDQFLQNSYTLRSNNTMNTDLLGDSASLPQDSKFGGIKMSEKDMYVYDSVGQIANPAQHEAEQLIQMNSNTKAIVTVTGNIVQTFESNPSKNTGTKDNLMPNYKSISILDYEQAAYGSIEQSIPSPRQVKVIEPIKPEPKVDYNTIQIENQEMIPAEMKRSSFLDKYVKQDVQPYKDQKFNEYKREKAIDIIPQTPPTKIMQSPTEVKKVETTGNTFKNKKKSMFDDMKKKSPENKQQESDLDKLIGNIQKKQRSPFGSAKPSIKPELEKEELKKKPKEQFKLPVDLSPTLQPTFGEEPSAEVQKEELQPILQDSANFGEETQAILSEEENLNKNKNVRKVEKVQFKKSDFPRKTGDNYFNQKDQAELKISKEEDQEDQTKQDYNGTPVGRNKRVSHLAPDTSYSLKSKTKNYVEPTWGVLKPKKAVESKIDSSYKAKPAEKQIFKKEKAPVLEKEYLSQRKRDPPKIEMQSFSRFTKKDKPEAKSQPPKQQVPSTQLSPLKQALARQTQSPVKQPQQQQSPLKQASSQNQSQKYQSPLKSKLPKTIDSQKATPQFPKPDEKLVLMTSLFMQSIYDLGSNLFENEREKEEERERSRIHAEDIKLKKEMRKTTVIGHVRKQSNMGVMKNIDRSDKTSQVAKHQAQNKEESKLAGMKRQTTLNMSDNQKAQKMQDEKKQAEQEQPANPPSRLQQILDKKKAQSQEKIERTKQPQKEQVASSNPYLTGSGFAAKKKEKDMTASDRLKMLKEKQKQAPKIDKEKKQEMEERIAKRANDMFSKQLQKAAQNANDYVESCSSDDLSFDSCIINKGDLMVIPLNLGKLGYHQMNCFTQDNPEDLARTFCRELKLGPKTKKQIIQLIEEKIKSFSSYNIQKV